MFLLMAHDYEKMWKAENKAIEVQRFEFAGEEREQLCRRYVLRNLQKRKQVDEVKPRFIMKRFRNIPSKVRQYMHPQATQKRDVVAKKDAEEDINKVKEPVSKLSRARNSADLFREKQRQLSANEQPIDQDPMSVSLCSEELECTSEVDDVSRSSARPDLSNLKVPNKLSENLTQDHVHILCDGSLIGVKRLPVDSHKHKCKLLARH